MSDGCGCSQTVPRKLRQNCTLLSILETSPQSSLPWHISHSWICSSRFYLIPLSLSVIPSFDQVHSSQCPSMTLLRAIRIKAEHGAPAQKGFPLKKVIFPKETPSGSVLPCVTGLLAVKGAVTLHILLPDSARPKAQSQDSSVSWKISALPLAEPSFATVPRVSTECLSSVVQSAAPQCSSGCMEMEPENSVREGGGIPESKHPTSGKYILLMSL